MGLISRIKTWVTAETLGSSDLNSEFDNILTLVNGNLSEANLADDAVEAQNISGLTGTGAVDLDNIPDGSGRPTISMDTGTKLQWPSNTTNLYSSAANTLKTDDALIVTGLLTGNAAAVITGGGITCDGAITLDKVDAVNKLFFGSLADTNLYRSAASNLKTDDLFTAVLGFVAGTGKFYNQTDVSGGTANDGNFVGGNGGFMWFDGVTNGTTIVTLDSTIDWRDRHIHVVGFIKQNDPASNFIPGGANDDEISGYLEASALAIDISTASFYSEAGNASGSPTASPSGQIGDFGAEGIFIAADDTSGNLRLVKDAAVEDEYAYSILVMFSNDQGHV